MIPYTGRTKPANPITPPPPQKMPPLNFDTPAPGPVLDLTDKFHEAAREASRRIDALILASIPPGMTLHEFAERYEVVVEDSPIYTREPDRMCCRTERTVTIRPREDKP